LQATSFAKGTAVNRDVRQFILAVAIVAITVWLFPNSSFSAILRSRNVLIELIGKTNKNVSDRLIAQLEENPLTPEQRQTIIEQIRVPRGIPYQITVTSDVSCTDCVRYARALEQTLREAGWLVRFNTVVGAGAGSSLRSIALMVVDLANPPPEASVLQRALSSAQIEVDLIRMTRDFADFPNDRRPILYLAANPRQR
jgi:hypothetical protein